jgi:anion-transporting  ArsA/GET3 family ATPase
VTALGHALAKELLLVTGKGGVGKTSVAAALALAAVAAGRRTIVAEVAARADAGRSLGGDGRLAVFEEREVGDGLHHISIDPEHAMQEYLIDQLPVKALADALVSSRLFGYLAAATPGMKELLTVGKVWELAQPVRRTPGARPYDLVIVDAPATGHGLALLQAPRTFAATARVGPIARQGRTIDQMLSDPARTGVIAVTTPEETPVSETLVLRAALREQSGLDLDAVIVNQLLRTALTADESRTVAAAVNGGGVGVVGGHRRAALHGALAHQRRARHQRAQVGRLRRGLGAGGDAPPVVTLPALAGEFGEALVPELARRLATR